MNLTDERDTEEEAFGAAANATAAMHSARRAALATQYSPDRDAYSPFHTPANRSTASDAQHGTSRGRTRSQGRHRADDDEFGRSATHGMGDAYSGPPPASERPQDASRNDPPGTGRWPYRATPMSGDRAAMFDGPPPNSSTHRARASEPTDSHRANNKVVILVKFAGFHDGALDYTEVAGTVELNDFAKQGFGSNHIDSALFSLPIVPVEAIDPVLHVLETAGASVVRYTEYPITPPVVWGNDCIRHVAKIDFHDDAGEGHSYSLLERMIHRSEEGSVGK